MDSLASKHVEAGYEHDKVYTIYLNELLRSEQLGASLRLVYDKLGRKGAEQVEEMRIQQFLRSGNYVVVEQPDGTHVRVFPMNDNVNISVL